MIIMIIMKMIIIYILLLFIITIIFIITTIVNDNKIIYANTGDWIQHKSYVILENGSVKLINLE